MVISGISQIEYSPEGAVTIPYSTLASSPASLFPAIEKGFGSSPDSLGIIIIRDLPKEYREYRHTLLKLSFKFAQLDEKVRESHSDPSSKFSFGWSHGKEIMNGRPARLDTLKGSYYANHINEGFSVPDEERKKFPEYYGENIWPKTDGLGIEGFEKAFKNLAAFIFQVGCELAAACRPFASSYLLDATLSLSDLIAKSQTTKARLLHYFPPSHQDSSLDNELVDDWCGFHLDHSLLTGLCPAMFLRPRESGEPEIITAPSTTSGLYIRTRGGVLTRVSIPPDCLAFQTGEALEIVTNGRLLATPHCVRIGDLSGISRESFALFLQPNTDVLISPNTTFGDFSKKIFQEHYQGCKEKSRGRDIENVHSSSFKYKV